MRIQHNIIAMNAYRNYNNNTSALSKNLEKLSSGYKINRAGDDAAGLAISEKMRAQITGLNAAQKNVKDGISLVKTAEGAMQEIQDMLNRMDYLATQSANGTYDNDVDRMNLQKEVNALRSEIDRIADSANFNGIKLLDGSQAGKVGETEEVAIDVAETITAGTTKTGGDVSLTGKFITTPGHAGMHTSTESSAQVDAKFSIDISGIRVTGASSDEASVKIEIGGTSFSVAVSVGNATNMGTGTQIATAVSGTTVNIGGTEFTLKDEGNGRISFNYTNANDPDADATQINTALKGAEVKVTADNTANGTDLKVEGDWVHGIQDPTFAADEVPAQMAGISLKLDNTIVADGNRLTIGDKTYVFKVGTDSQTTTAAATDKLITLTSNDAAGIQSAIEQMVLNTPEIDSKDAAGANSTKFEISAVDEKTIHIDQVAKTGGAKNAPYDEKKLKDLFSLTAAGNDASKATMELTASVDSGVAAGDRVTYGGKSYIIAAATNEAKSEISVDDFNALLTKAGANNLKTATDTVLASSTYAGYTATVGTDGKVTITGKDTDDETSMGTLKAAIEQELSKLSMSKLDSANVGAGGLTLQIGDTSDPFNQMSVKIGDMHVDAMKSWARDAKGNIIKDADGNITYEESMSIADIDISNQDSAAKAVNVIKDAINYVSSIRGDLGAIQNRLEHTQNNLSVMAENIQDAESTIRDTDVAEEMMSYVKNNILVQSAQAMLAQANQVPQGVLQLLG